VGGYSSAVILFPPNTIMKNASQQVIIGTPFICKACLKQLKPPDELIVGGMYGSKTLVTRTAGTTGASYLPMGALEA
jgi:hypothetical protein